MNKLARNSQGSGHFNLPCTQCKSPVQKKDKVRISVVNHIYMPYLLYILHKLTSGSKCCLQRLELLCNPLPSWLSGMREGKLCTDTSAFSHRSLQADENPHKRSDMSQLCFVWESLANVDFSVFCLVSMKPTEVLIFFKYCAMAQFKN